MKKDSFKITDNTLTNNIYEDIFKFTAAKRVDEIAADCLGDETLEKEVRLSDEFTGIMQRHFKKLKNKEKSRRRNKILFRAAAGFILFLAVSTAVIYNVEAFREPIYHFIFNADDKSTTITVKDKNISYSSVADKIHGMYLPSYVPEGYSIDMVVNEPKNKVVFFKNQNDDWIFMEYLYDSVTIKIDTENAELKEVPLNDDVAKLYTKKETSTLLFTLDNNKLILQGHIPEEEIVKIALSLEYYN